MPWFHLEQRDDAKRWAVVLLESDTVKCWYRPFPIADDKTLPIGYGSNTIQPKYYHISPIHTDWVEGADLAKESADLWNDTKEGEHYRIYFRSVVKRDTTRVISFTSDVPMTWHVRRDRGQLLFSDTDPSVPITFDWTVTIYEAV